MVTRFAKLKIRRDTAANWTSNDPTLLDGEFAYETDTKKLKVGDGSTPWTSLGYLAIPTNVDHNNLSNIQGGTTAEYYHLTNAQHSALTTTVNNLTTPYRIAYVNALGVLTESLNIVTDAVGNLGIGATPTNSSSYKTLDIRGTVGGQILLGRSGSIDSFYYSSSTITRIGAGVGGALHLMSNSSGAGTGDLIIDLDGNVLIGTTTQYASEKLGVNGNAYVNGHVTQKPSASVTPANNGELMVEATSNTTLTFKLKGTDGTVRSGTITLS